MGFLKQTALADDAVFLTMIQKSSERLNANCQLQHISNIYPVC